MSETNFYSVQNESTKEMDTWPTFTEHSLFEAAVTEASRELQVSRGMALMCAFGAMATACQHHIDVQLPTGFTVPASLMLLTIAESGERKTTTQSYFFEEIHHSNGEADRAADENEKEHNVLHKLWNVQNRQLERKYNKQASLEDELAKNAALNALADHIKAEPKKKRSGKFLYEDTTPQALVQMLYEGTPNGCLLTSEANSIFSGKALGELDKLNTLWDGKDVIVDRISREGFILRNARLTLSLMAQPSVINRFMGKRGEEARGTGFLARFLVARPATMAGKRKTQKLSELPRKKTFNERISQRLNFPPSTDRQILIFSEAAKDKWFIYSAYLEEQMQQNGIYHYTRDHASKLLENTSRLAAILHTFERETESEIEINLKTLEYCWKISQICSNHFIINLADEPQIISDTNLLANYLRKQAYKDSQQREKADTRGNQPYPGVSTKVSLTHLKRFGPNCLRGRTNSERLDASIDLLTKLGHLKKEAGLYKFSESILSDCHGPELKNGEHITIKELPLFSEQIFEKPKPGKSVFDRGGFLIKP